MRIRTKPRVGSPRLRLGRLKSRSGMDRRRGLAVHRPVTVAPGARVSASLRSRSARLRPLRRALGLRPTVNGETPKRRSNRRPMPPRDEKTVPAPHPSGAALSGRAEARSGSPPGGDRVGVRHHRASPARNGAVRRPGAPFRPRDGCRAIGGARTRPRGPGIDESAVFATAGCTRRRRPAASRARRRTIRARSRAARAPGRP